MIYDPKTQITLECSQCGTYKTVLRPPDIPLAVRLVTLLCPECIFDDETTSHVERWFIASGVEMPDDAKSEPLVWPCSDCPPIGYPTDKTRCSGCPNRQIARVL
jgi:hypothetical protein